MSILELQETLRAEVIKTALEKFNIELEQVGTEVPPKTELGDLAFPIAFELAKRIKQATGEKQNPRNIAETLKAALETFDFVGRVEVAGAGYLNVFYNRTKFLAENTQKPEIRNRKGLRRAYFGQSEQSRAYRTRPKFGARRHVRADFAGKRKTRRSSELY